jgi:rhodanese-related sulfurtransferase
MTRGKTVLLLGGKGHSTVVDRIVRSVAYAALIGSLVFAGGSHAAPSDEAVKAMEEYLDFVDYGGGTMLPEQIPSEDWKRFYVIDARDKDQFARGHIPGAVNIEWRQVLAQRASLPRDKSILIYCNQGTLSAQAAFALRVAGFDNVRVLQGGFTEWKAKGGFEAAARTRGAAAPSK